MTLDHDDLRAALKRCSPATYYAACKFRQTRDATQIPAIVVGVIERYVDRERRPLLQADPEPLRLREDLGLDSLTMMEVVMLAEEVFGLSVSNEELARLQTLGEVHRFLALKVHGEPSATDGLPAPASANPLVS